MPIVRKGFAFHDGSFTTSDPFAVDPQRAPYARRALLVTMSDDDDVDEMERNVRSAVGAPPAWREVVMRPTMRVSVPDGSQVSTRMGQWVPIRFAREVHDQVVAAGCMCSFEECVDAISRARRGVVADAPVDLAVRKVIRT